jgi:integrase
MARPISIPKLTLHKASGKAVVRLSGIDVYCGLFGTPEAKGVYDREIAQWLARGRTQDPSQRKPKGADKLEQGYTVNELLLAFWNYAEHHYRRPDGTLTNEVNEYKQTLRVVRELYGLTLAAKFGPLALKAIRLVMIDRGWCRGLINQRVNRVRRVFKWGAGEELIPFSVYERLTTVAGLQIGRTEARESERVEPVADEVVESTLPFLNRYVRGLVEFQRLTGCRPGESCGIRRSDIDAGGAVWLYRPSQHKTAWRGKPRVISIGPKAQKLLRGFFTPNLEDYLFSPQRAVTELHANRTASRKTPKYPSHMKRNQHKRKVDPKRVPAEKYTVTAYEHAIARACDKAFPAPGLLAQQKGEIVKAWKARLTAEQRTELDGWQSSHRWSPNQLRHSFATEVRKSHGLEAAQVLLGHARADVTQVYAERNHTLATRVASEIG